MIYGNPSYESMVLVRNSTLLPIWEQSGILAPLLLLPYPGVDQTKRELRQMVMMGEGLSPQRLAYVKRIDQDLFTVMSEVLADYGIDESVEDITKRVKEHEWVIDYLKMKYNRPRPFQAAGVYNIPLYPRLESAAAHSASYPSGHTLFALFFRHSYMQEYPELAQPLLDFALDVKKSREEGGVHYPSDGQFSFKVYKHLKDYI